LSGIGAGHYLQTECPWAEYEIFEARDAIGGTWDLFRYPGIRSDSDMHTLGYSFRPWDGEKSIADGDSILQYIKDTARESGVDTHIRFNHRITAANWSTPDSLWRITAERTDTDESFEFTDLLPLLLQRVLPLRPRVPARLRGHGRLRGHHRASPGLARRTRRERKEGRGHRQRGDRRHARPRARPIRLPRHHAAAIAQLHRLVAREEPRRLGAAQGPAGATGGDSGEVVPRPPHPGLLRGQPEVPEPGSADAAKGLERQLPPGYDIATHFTPRYNPWDQRFCAVPNGDLFKALSDGTASVVTDRSSASPRSGLLLSSGHELEADIVVTATGLELLFLGGIVLSVDGARVDPATRLTYKGMMIEGVPNMALAIGYTNASWTLKCDLTCDYVCRLLNYMHERALTECVPRNKDGASAASSPFSG
jgi:monooxygenase